MNSAAKLEEAKQESAMQLNRRAAYSKDRTILADIYQQDTNLVYWQRQLSKELVDEVATLLAEKPSFQASVTASPDSVLFAMNDYFCALDCTKLNEDIAELVSMFCCLFDLQRVGIRLTALNKAMCPKFHVDRVPCRLITTYLGAATEWLPHQSANRNKLGRGSNGLPDHESGIYSQAADIHQLASGDVALLKGESWQGNEGAGIVHRSPALAAGEQRLLLTMDFAE